MLYVLTDKKDSKFKIATSMENINMFLNYPVDNSFEETMYDLSKDRQYNNEQVQYQLKKTRVHVLYKEEDAFIADVRDIMQGLAVIEFFETEDEGNEDYEYGCYDVVDDDHQSLLA